MSKVKAFESLLAQEVEGLRHDRDMLLFIVQRFLINHDSMSPTKIDGSTIDTWPTLAHDARTLVKSLKGG